MLASLGQPRVELESGALVEAARLVDGLSREVEDGGHFGVHRHGVVIAPAIRGGVRHEGDVALEEAHLGPAVRLV